jgi:hypothetical protein
LSTRANVIITDGWDELIYYRHSDGYPAGTLPSLNRFLNLVKQGKIRDNTDQAAGWLILIGADEYGVTLHDGHIAPNNLGAGLQWKIGAFEPTTDLHGDIEHLYVVDLEAKLIKHCTVGHDFSGNPKIPPSFYCGRFNPERIDGHEQVDRKHLETT